MVMRPGRFVECPLPPSIIGGRGRGRGGPRRPREAAPSVPSSARLFAPWCAPGRASSWKLAEAPVPAASAAAGDSVASVSGEVEAAVAVRAQSAAATDTPVGSERGEGGAPTCRSSPSPTPSSGYNSDISFEWTDDEEGADADDEESVSRTPSPFGVPSWDVREVTVSERWGGLAITPGFSIWSPTVEDEPLLAARDRTVGSVGAVGAPEPTSWLTEPCLPEVVTDAALNDVADKPPTSTCWAEEQLGLYPDREPAGPRQAVVRAANQCGSWGVFGAWHPMPNEDEAAVLAEIALREDEEARARAAVKRAERLARYGRKAWWAGRYRRQSRCNGDTDCNYDDNYDDYYESRNYDSRSLW